MQYIITGLVQGVFFRSHTKECADRLGITGYVENLPDGTVKVVTTGDGEPLMNLLQEDPGNGRIDHIDSVPYEETCDEFTVRR